MANPSTDKGHIRIANDLWFAWMKTGPLEERVFKAIIWECWGWKDRRDLKQPVPIKRSTIVDLTGISDKSLVSRLINSLVKKNLVTKHSDGRLSTPAYWPNQDYESWVSDPQSRDQSVPRDESVPKDQSVIVPRDQSVPVPRDQSVTPTLYTNMYQTKVQTCTIGQRIMRTWVSLFRPLSNPTPKEIVAANAMVADLADWNDDRAVAYLIAWHDHRWEEWRQQNPGRDNAPGLPWFKEKFRAYFADNKLPAPYQKGNDDGKTDGQQGTYSGSKRADRAAKAGAANAGTARAFDQYLALDTQQD